MDWIQIAIIVGIVFVLAVVFGSKASAPSLFEGIMFFLGVGVVLLISVDRWIGWVNWVVNNAKTVFGMADQKFDFSETINALKSGDISRTKAGTITITGVLAIAALRFVSIFLAFVIGAVVGIIIKVWANVLGFSIGGLI